MEIITGLIFLLLIFIIIKYYFSIKWIKEINGILDEKNNDLYEHIKEVKKYKKKCNEYKNKLQELGVHNEKYKSNIKKCIYKYTHARNKIEELSNNIENFRSRFYKYKTELEPLRKYMAIQNADNEAKRILKSAHTILETADKKYEEKLLEAKELALSELSKSREKMKIFQEESSKKLMDDKKKSAEYETSIIAMKNIIKGYGDEYIIPNHSLLDDLAIEYNHKRAGQELEKVRKLIESMIRNDKAADCDYVEAYRKRVAKEFVLDAYIGKVDTIMSKVKHNNYGKLKQQLNDAFSLVNHNGKAFRNARILSSYHEVILKQLKQAVIVHELKLLDREEQRRIKQEIREETRAIREYEKARKQIEKEEKMLQKSMAKVRKQLELANDEQKLKFEKKLLELQEKLTKAEEKNQRALSMAQQTRRGHVYVISNVGSFGDDIFKIGMTRRLEPLDRVKELGDASVPFSFDVHAMIHSDDAPTLEKALHLKFSNNQVNRVNPRKEFFNLNILDIKREVEELGVDAHWTMQAEAMEYRKSLIIGEV